MLGLWQKRSYRQRMQAKKAGKRAGEGTCGPHEAPSQLGYSAAQLCEPRMGRAASESTTSSRSHQLYGPANASTAVVPPADDPARPNYLRNFEGQIGDQDLRVALAVQCNTPPIIWGICRQYFYNSDIIPGNSPSSHFRLSDTAISVPFLIDTGADVTVIPQTLWPPGWKLEDAPTVGGVGGVSIAKKSVELISITLHDKRRPETEVQIHVYVLLNVPPLLGRDALSRLNVRVTNLP